MIEHTTKSTRLLVLPLLAVVAGTGLFLSGRPAPWNWPLGGPPDVATLLPAATLAVLTVDGRPCSGAGSELAIARVLAEPEMKQFVAQFFPDSGKEPGGLTASFEAATGFRGADVLDVLRQRVTVAWMGVGAERTTRDGVPTTRIVPDLVAVLELPSDGDRALDLIRRLEAMARSGGLGTITDATLAGVSVRHVEPRERDGVEAWAAVSDGLLVVATRAKTLEGILGRLKSGAGDASLASVPAWAAVRQKVSRPASVFAVYWNVEKTLAAFADELPEEVPPFLDASGFGRLQAVGCGVDLDGPAIHDRIYAHLPGGGKLRAVFDPPGAAISAPTIVPAETGLLLSGLCDPGKLVDHILNVAGEFGLEGIAENALDTFRDQMGFDAKKDLLDQVGPEFAIFGAWPGRSLIPDVGLVVQLRDRPRFEAVLGQAVDKVDAFYDLGRVAAGDGTVEYLEGKRRARRPGVMGRLTLGAPELRPSWTYVNDRLVVTPWPQAARNIRVGLAAKTPRLAERPDFAALLAKLKAGDPLLGTAVLAYVDVSGLIGFLCDNGVPLAQALLGPEVPVDFTRFPVTATITGHLFGAVAAGRWADDGFLAEALSPTGILVPGVLVGGALVVFGARQEAIAGPFEDQPRPPDEIRPSRPPAPPPPGPGREGGGKKDQASPAEEEGGHG